MLKKYHLIILFLFLSSCDCGDPLELAPIQNSDKKLACKDIILEINEAEHYREQAKNSKGISVGEALAPPCWISGYMNSEEAIKSANTRINYLGGIYDLLDCSGQEMVKEEPKTPEKESDKKKENTQNKQNNLNNPPRQIPYPIKNQMGFGQNIPKDLHEHIDKTGKKYQHLHPFVGPHKH